MATDPRQLRPTALCQLLNSTPLGEVIDQRRLHAHRTKAGLRIGDGKKVDLLRYTAWLVQMRHAPKAVTSNGTTVDLAEAAEAAAELSRSPAGHSQSLSTNQEYVLAALLSESTYAAAAAKTGVAKSTICRWMQLPEFRAAYRQARRELVEFAIGRVQASTAQAVETLLSVTRQGRRDSDRVRAAIAILEHACRGLAEGDHGPVEPLGTTDVVKLLGSRLRHLDQSALSTAEKSRLSATLADALLRAIGVDVLDKRLEAIQGVLLTRKQRKS